MIECCFQNTSVPPLPGGHWDDQRDATVEHQESSSYSLLQMSVESQNTPSVAIHCSP